MCNPLCQGEHCSKSNGQVRLIPLDDGKLQKVVAGKRVIATIVRMCATCYVTEMDYNDSLQTRILAKVPFSTFPLVILTYDDFNRVLAESDEYPSQLDEYFTEVYTKQPEPFNWIPLGIIT